MSDGHMNHLIEAVRDDIIEETGLGSDASYTDISDKIGTADSWFKLPEKAITIESKAVTVVLSKLK